MYCVGALTTCGYLTLVFQLFKIIINSIDEALAVREMMELSMSYSMSFPPSETKAPTAPVGAPTAPSAPVGVPAPASPTTPTVQPPPTPSEPTAPNPSGPTLPPTLSFEPSMTAFPTDDGQSSIPSDEPSTVPSASPTLSFEPSLTAEPSLPDLSISQRPVGDGGTEDVCPSDSVLSLGDPSDNTTTPVFLAVGYRVESTSTTGNSSVFADPLGAELISTAVKAILGCKQDWDGLVFPQTTEIGKLRFSTCISWLVKGFQANHPHSSTLMLMSMNVISDFVFFWPFSFLSTNVVPIISRKLRVCPTRLTPHPAL